MIKADIMLASDAF
jgi:hypothetical protein